MTNYTLTTQKSLETNTILQLIDFILSDGRGEIYQSQREILENLCSIVSDRARIHSSVDLTNQEGIFT